MVSAAFFPGFPIFPIFPAFPSVDVFPVLGALPVFPAVGVFPAAGAPTAAKCTMSEINTGPIVGGTQLRLQGSVIRQCNVAAFEIQNVEMRHKCYRSTFGAMVHECET